MKAQILANETKKGKQDKSESQLLVGPSPIGPKRYLHCLNPFARGETWHRHTSPPDPDYGSYSYGIHDQCADESRRTALGFKQRRAYGCHLPMCSFHCLLHNQ